MKQFVPVTGNVHKTSSNVRTSFVSISVLIENRLSANLNYHLDEKSSKATCHSIGRCHKTTTKTWSLIDRGDFLSRFIALSKVRFKPATMQADLVRHISREVQVTIIIVIILWGHFKYGATRCRQLTKLHTNNVTTGIASKSSHINCNKEWFVVSNVILSNALFASHVRRTIYFETLNVHVCLENNRKENESREWTYWTTLWSMQVKWIGRKLQWPIRPFCMSYRWQI